MQREIVIAEDVPVETSRVMEELQKNEIIKSAGLPTQFFISIDMSEELENTLSEPYVVSEFDAITFSNICKITQVFPIVRQHITTYEDIVEAIEKRGADEEEDEESSHENESSSESPSISPIARGDNLEEKHMFAVYFDSLQKCMYRVDVPNSGYLYDESAEIIGIAINPNIPLIDRSKYDWPRFMYEKDKILSYKNDIYLRCNLLNKELVHRCFGKYEKKGDCLIKMFVDDDDVKKETLRISKFYKYMYEYISSTFSMYLWDRTVMEDSTELVESSFSIYDDLETYTIEEPLKNIPHDKELDTLVPWKIHSDYKIAHLYDMETLTPENIEKRNRYKDINKSNMQKNLQLIREIYYDAELRYTYMLKFGVDAARKLSTQKTVKEIVDKETYDMLVLNLEKRRTYIQTVLNNKSAWVRMVSAIHKSTAKYEKIENYLALKKEYPTEIKMSADPKKGESMITIGDIPAICPHIVDEMELLVNDKNAEIGEYIHENYGKQTQEGTFCRICGELLDKRDTSAFDMKAAGMTRPSDETNDFLWKIVGYITRSTLEFNPPREGKNLNSFINAIISSIAPYVEGIEVKLRKSRTMTTDEFESNKRLYAIIYTYCAIVKNIVMNPTSMRFNTDKFAFGDKELNPLLSHSMRNIYNTNRELLGRAGFDEKKLKETVIVAYGSMTSINKVDLDRKIDVYYDYLVSDPIYRGIVMLNMIHVLEKMKNPTIENVRKEWVTQSLLDNTIGGEDVLLNYRNIYSQIKLPNPVEYNLERLAHGTKIREFFRKANSIMRLIGIGILMDYAKSDIVLIPPINTEITMEDGIADFVVRSSPEHEAFREKYEKITEDSLTIKKMYMEIFARPRMLRATRHIPYTKTFITDPSLLARVYGDEKGKWYDLVEAKGKVKFHRHKFNKTAYVKVPQFVGRSMDLYRPEDVEIGSKLTDDNIVVDYICSICGVAMENASNEYNGLLIVQRNQKMTSFYNFHTGICPVKDEKTMFHTYKDDVCTKCGVTPEMIKDKDVAYYEKYKKDESKISVSKQGKGIYTPLPSLDSIPKESWEQMRREMYRIYPGKLSEEEYKNLIGGLGLAEGSPREYLTSGYPTTQTSYCRRAMNLHSMIFSIKDRITTISCADNFARLPDWLSDYFETLNMEEIEKSKAVSFTDPYLEKYMEYREQYDDIINFQLNYILQFLNYLFGFSCAPLTAFFVKHIVDREVNLLLPTREKASAYSASALNIQTADYDEKQSTIDADVKEVMDSYGYMDMDYNGENDDL